LLVFCWMLFCPNAWNSAGLLAVRRK